MNVNTNVFTGTMVPTQFFQIFRENMFKVLILVPILVGQPQVVGREGEGVEEEY